VSCFGFVMGRASGIYPSFANRCGFGGEDCRPALKVEDLGGFPKNERFKSSVSWTLRITWPRLLWLLAKRQNEPKWRHFGPNTGALGERLNQPQKLLGPWEP